MKSGLYRSPGAAETCRAARTAKSLHSPETKESKQRNRRRLPGRLSEPGRSNSDGEVGRDWRLADDFDGPVPPSRRSFVLLSIADSSTASTPAIGLVVAASATSNISDSSTSNCDDADGPSTSWEALLNDVRNRRSNQFRMNGLGTRTINRSPEISKRVRL